MKDSTDEKIVPENQPTEETMPEDTSTKTTTDNDTAFSGSGTTEEGTIYLCWDQKNMSVF
ncbi:MAG: hypothetical protein ACQES4_07790 [Bacillota bacterium]